MYREKKFGGEDLGDLIEKGLGGRRLEQVVYYRAGDMTGGEVKICVGFPALVSEDF